MGDDSEDFLLNYAMFLRASRKYHLAFRVPKFTQGSSCDIKRDRDLGA